MKNEISSLQKKAKVLKMIFIAFTLTLFGHVSRAEQANPYNNYSIVTADTSYKGWGFVKKITKPAPRSYTKIEMESIIIRKAFLVNPTLHDRAVIATFKHHIDGLGLRNKVTGDRYEVTASMIPTLVKLSTEADAPQPGFFTTRVDTNGITLESYWRKTAAGERCLEIDLNKLPDVELGAEPFPTVAWLSLKCGNPLIFVTETKVEEDRGNPDDGEDNTPIAEEKPKPDVEVREKTVIEYRDRDIETGGSESYASASAGISFSAGVSSYQEPYYGQQQCCPQPGNVYIDNSITDNSYFSYNHQSTTNNYNHYHQHDSTPQPTSTGGPTHTNGGTDEGQGGPGRNDNGETAWSDGRKQKFVRGGGSNTTPANQNTTSPTDHPNSAFFNAKDENPKQIKNDRGDLAYNSRPAKKDDGVIPRQESTTGRDNIVKPEIKTNPMTFKRPTEGKATSNFYKGDYTKGNGETSHTRFVKGGTANNDVRPNNNSNVNKGVDHNGFQKNSRKPDDFKKTSSFAPKRSFEKRTLWPSRKVLRKGDC